MKSGVVMGLSEALKEEVTFDKEKVTSTNWSRYKILTMEETPEIKVVQISRDDKGFGGGSEAANAVVPPAVAAAFFDATGVCPRRIPLNPAYVAPLLQGLIFTTIPNYFEHSSASLAYTSRAWS
jgi:CO/xanthine dehydrogenase Mo-binding subunit